MPHANQFVPILDSQTLGSTFIRSNLFDNAKVGEQGFRFWSHDAAADW